MEADKNQSGPPPPADGHDKAYHEGIVANLSEAELERLSANYGAELYSMVEDGVHKEIVERNSAMRETVKSFGKSKLEQRSKVDMAGAFITLSRDTTKRDSEAVSSKGTEAREAYTFHLEHEQKCLRQILGLSDFYKHISGSKVPFMVMLDVELGRLLEWLSPSEEERAAKEMVLLKLEIVVNSLFPNAKMEVFGSYVSGLSLPGSDIDVCISVNGDGLTSLKLLVYALNRLGLLHSFECVFNTPVPVIKAIDKHTGVRVDISMWQKTATTTTMFVKKKCDQFKHMQPLIILLKFFLQMRNLSDTYFGGIGSYLLYCMVLSFLQMHDSSCRKGCDEVNTLALLFVDFFYYWGFIRDYEQFATTVCGLGHVFPRTTMKERDDGMLCCKSPLDPSVDIGKNAYNMPSARTAFQQAFFALRSKELFIDTRHSHDFNYEKSTECIMEQIYDVSHPIFQHRQKRRPKYPVKDAYMYNSFPNFKDSLEKVCNQLCSITENAEVGSVFNAQKQLMDSLSHKFEEGKGPTTSETPFYIISEAITREFYSNN